MIRIFVFCPIKNRAIWKNQVTCLKIRHHSSSAPVRYTPKTSSKVKLSETSPQVKNLEKSNYFSRADASESEINGKESDRGKFSQREVSQIQNEMQNDLMFGDMGHGKLLSNILQYYNICNLRSRFQRYLCFWITQCMGTMFAKLSRIVKWKTHMILRFVLTKSFFCKMTILSLCGGG